MSDDKKDKSSAATVAIGSQLLIDGGFESAKVGADTWTHQAQVGGWKSDTEVEVWGKGFYGLKASEGNQFAELDYDPRTSRRVRRARRARARRRAGRVRAWLGLDARPIVVVAAGAEPTPRAQRVVDALARLATRAQLVICHPARVPALAPGVAARVVGTTDRFAELLSAADAVVGKAGGGTVAEVCALGRPLVVVDPYPGQEEDNAAWLASHGAAVVAAGPATAAAALAAILTQPGLAHRLATTAARLGRPRAADAVVGLTLAELARAASAHPLAA